MLDAIIPQAGPVYDVGIRMKATFREATEVRQRAGDASDPGKGIVMLLFPSSITPPRVTTCRGESPDSRRCVSQEGKTGQIIRLSVPPHPLGLPAFLETTWMDVVYF